jgi:hypothetical protein
MLRDRIHIGNGEYRAIRARSKEGLFAAAARACGGTEYSAHVNCWNGDPAGNALYQVTVLRPVKRSYGNGYEIVREVYVSAPRNA